jgi:hypothetical protein
VERIEVSVFVLPHLASHTVDRRLDVKGVLATKLHAILDRGTRRDFFDLYVTLQIHQLGIEAALPGEGRRDWSQVKDYFLRAVGALLVPPGPKLTIQKRVVDVSSR